MKITTKQYYKRLSDLTKAGLVKRKNGRYSTENTPQKMKNKRGWERLNSTDCRHQMGCLQLWVLEL